MFRCRHCSLCAHADRTAAVIVRDRDFARYREWWFSYTPSVDTESTGWRQRPSRSNWQSKLLE